MLVLSRKPGESIVFPALGVTVRLLHAQGKRIRIGIDAPESVEISRGEVASEFGEKIVKDQSVADRHAYRNSLHTAVLAISLADKQLQAGYVSQAETTLRQALARLQALEFEQGRESMSVIPSGDEQLDVLVVDDDDNERALMRGLLELEGFTVATAHDGLAALEFVAQTRPKVVLLDMMMPRCDGRTAAERLRKMPGAPMKLWAVSGTSPESLGITTTQEAGLDCWFSKPLNPVHLVQQLRS